MDISHEFTEVFTQHHTVDVNTKIEKVKYSFGKFTVYYEQDGKKHRTKGDALLIATGVVPNTDDLGLENTDVQISQRGYVSVDKRLLTRAKNIYAVGDVIGNYLFRHSVNFESEYLFGQLFGDAKKATITYPPMPHAVFSHPETAAVGRTEQQLEADGVDFVVGTNKYIRSAMGLARMSEHGFVKVLFDKKTKKLLGAHILGEEASTMIHQAIYAMTYGATVDDLLNMIYVHPALPEIFRNACRSARKNL